MFSFLFVKMALKNILRNRLRSFYTGISVMAGITGLVLIAGYISRTKLNLELSAVYLEHKGHLAIMQPDAVSHFLNDPKKYALQSEAISAIYASLKDFETDIDFTSEYLTTVGLISNGTLAQPVVALGIEGTSFKKIYSNREVLKWIPEWIVNTTPSTLANDSAVSLTQRIQERLGPKNTDLQLSGMTFRGDFNATNVEASGLHTTGNTSLDNNLIFANLKSLHSLVDSNAIQYIAVFLKNAGARKQIIGALKNSYAIKDLKLGVVSFDDEKWNSYYAGTLGFLYSMGLFSILVVMFIVVLVNLATTMLSITERLREIGTLRSLGYKPRTVQFLFAFESFLLTTIFATMGFLLAMPVSSAINASRIMYRPPGAAIDVPFVLSLEPGFAILIGTGLALLCFVTAFWFTGSMVRRPIDNLLRDSGG